MKKDITIEQKYGKAVEITNEEEARAYFEECVQHTMSFERSREEAEKIERENIGYYAGYYSYDAIARVGKIYNTSHPIFGQMDRYQTMNVASAMTHE